MKAAIYCRLSEEDRNKQNKSDDSNSIQNQKIMLQQYVLDHGWDLHAIYSDDDYAGADRNRPAFKQLLADAEARKFDIVLCKTQSRFTRELELVEKYIHGLFPIWGIRFVSIVDNADTANKGNKKSRQINGLVNEWYLEDMSENIRSVLTSRRKNGFHIGSFAPYGYQKDPMQKGHLIIDPEAAEIVKEIFTQFANGYGKSAIARQLNNRGVPTPSEYKRRKGISYLQPKEKLSHLWSYSSIQNILRNEVYIGNLVQGKVGSISYKTKELRPKPASQWIKVNNTHEPIVPPALWNRVQDKISAHYRPFSINGKIHPFSGKVRCMHCGAALSIHTNRGRRYLQCHTPHISKDACSGAFIPAQELETVFLRELRALFQKCLDRDMLEQNLQHQNSQKIPISEDIHAYTQKLETLTAAIHQLAADQLTGFISKQDCMEMKKSFQAEKEYLESLIAAEQFRIAQSESSTIQDLTDPYNPPGILTRSITETFLDYIKIGKRNKATGAVPIFIFWNI